MEGGESNPSSKNPTSSFVEGLNGPLTADIPSSRRYFLTSSIKAIATSLLLIDSKYPKNPHFSL
ncbi:MAG: hypothetical protein BWY26_00954 [Elusimicrobia bacterium ADurb.Bin231]|nr:MAG: hypothetical protein BWY26_00954 [Elusimicrobia bacterium ADurb.Bin231]